MKQIYPKTFRRGNIYRIKTILEEKKKVKIAFLGGSLIKGEKVEEEKCFVSGVSKKLAGIMKTGFQYEVANFGENGISSAGACFRIQKLLDWNPDIVFLDFSMNDTEEKFYYETYESIVRKVLDTGAAVVLVIFCNENGANAAGHQKRIGTFYNLPVLDMGNTLRNDIEEGKYTWHDIAIDKLMLNEKGHKIERDYFILFFRMVNNIIKDNTYEMPEEYCFHCSFHDLVVETIQVDEKISEKENELLFQKECQYSMLMLEYVYDKAVNDAVIEVFIDGRLKKVLGVHRLLGGERNTTVYLDGSGEPEVHNVEIRTGRERGRKGWDYSKLKLRLGMGIQKPFTLHD